MGKPRTFSRRSALDKRSTLASVRGRRLLVAGNPTPITRIPWNCATLEFTVSTGEDDLTVADVRSNLAAQLLLPSDIHFEVKLRTVRAWGPRAADQMDLPGILSVFDISDLSSGVKEVVCVLEDYGDGTSRSAVGYRWPTAQQEQVLVTSSHSGVFLVETAGIKLVRFELLWRPRVTGTRTSGSVRACNRTATYANTIQECLERDPPWEADDPCESQNHATTRSGVSPNSSGHQSSLRQALDEIQAGLNRLTLAVQEPKVDLPAMEQNIVTTSVDALSNEGCSSGSPVGNHRG